MTPDNSRFRQMGRIVMAIAGYVCLTAAPYFYPALHLGPPFSLMQDPSKVPRNEGRDAGLGTLRRGTELFERGDTAGALPLLNQAAQQLNAVGNLKGEAEAVRALGDVYASQGEIFTSVAADRYQQAVELFRKASTSGTTSGLNVAADMNYNAQVTLAKLGDLYFRQGKYAEAQRYYNLIAPDKPKIDAFDAAEKGRRRAETLKAKPGSTKSRTESVGRRFGDIFKKRPTLDTLGSVKSSTDEAAATVKDAADTTLGVAEDLHRANLLLKGYILSDLSLGRVALLQGDEASAQQRFESALKFATKYPPIFGKGPAAKRYQVVAQTELGNLAFKQKRFGDAAKLYADARERAQAAKRPDLSWPAARGIGRAQWAIAQALLDQAGPGQVPSQFNMARDAAITAYRESIATIEELRGRSIRGDEARQSFADQTAEVYSEFTDFLASLALRAGGEDSSKPLQGEALTYAREGFTSGEKGRSRALLDSLGEASHQIEEGIDPTLVQKRSQLFEQQSELADQLIGLSEQDRDGKARDDEALETDIDRLSVEAAQLEAQICASSPRYAALTSPVALSIADAQSQLADGDTVLLDYSIGEKRSYLWVISRDSVWLHPLGPRAEITGAASKVRELLIASGAVPVPEPAATSSQAASRSMAETKDSAKSKTAGNAKPTVSGPGPSTKGSSSKAGTAGTPRTGRTVQPGSSRDLKAVTVPPKTKVRPLVETPEARKFAEASYTLYNAILAPAAPALAGKRLLVVRDDILNYIPFEALVSSLPGNGGDPPADFASLAYLARSHEVAYTPSATVIATIRRRGHTTKAQGALIIGDPVFDSNDPRAKSQSQASPAESEARDLLAKTILTGDQPPVAGSPASEDSPKAGQAAVASGVAGKIPRLPATRTESTSIAKIIRQSGSQADLWLDLKANESDLLAGDLRQYRFIHLATHGLLNADHPQFSGLVLSLVGNPPGSDGFLRTQEIFNMRLGAPLVMLSACKTGLGRIRKGEGLIGLTRAFMYAGATTVGVSLWPVDDNSTAELMTDFYGRLLGAKKDSASAAADQVTLSAALRAAQLRLVDERRYSAPFFWAPFILVGDYR